MIVKCSWCGEELNRIPSIVEKRNHHFCNRECYGNWLSKNNVGENSPCWKERFTFICGYCGREFDDISFSNRKFCSMECSNKYWGERHRGENNPSYGDEYKLCGEDNPNWNGGKETRNCKKCGKEFETYASKNSKYCSKECYLTSTQFKNLDRATRPSYSHTLEERIQMSCSHRGISIENWDGFTSERPNQTSFRNKVYERDNYTCQFCGDSKGGNLNAHHILPYAEFPLLRESIENGITLCENCHRMIHKKGYNDVIKLMVSMRGLDFFHNLTTFEPLLGM